DIPSGERMTILEADIVAQRKHKRFSFIGYFPSLAEARNKIAILIRCQQSLEHIGKNLGIFYQLHVDRFARLHRIGDCYTESSAPWDIFLRIRLFQPWSEPPRLFQIFIRLLILTTEIGEGRSKGE